MLVALSSAAAAPPSIYWTSAPSVSNETLLVAGAGLGGADVRLCDDQHCKTLSKHQPSDVAAWDLSVKFTLPTLLQPPCYVNVANTAGNITFALNRPDVWWASTGAPARHPPDNSSANAAVLSPMIIAGDAAGLHVFGRAIGWAAGGTCINATQPVATPSTQLLLDDGTRVPAAEATCFEARFDTTSLRAGVYTEAQVVTAWGASDPFTLTVAPTPPPSRCPH